MGRLLGIYFLLLDWGFFCPFGGKQQSSALIQYSIILIVTIIL